MIPSAPIHSLKRLQGPGYAIMPFMPKLGFLPNVLLTTFDLLQDTLSFIRVSQRPRCALAAENL
jgi:hypothetical protein